MVPLIVGTLAIAGIALAIYLAHLAAKKRREAREEAAQARAAREEEAADARILVVIINAHQFSDQNTPIF